MAFDSIKKYLPSRKGLMGINARNLDMIYVYNPRRHFPNVDDKIRCKILLAEKGIPTPETYHIVDGPSSLAAWREKLAGRNEFVIKPNSSYGGKGIVLAARDGDRFHSSEGPWEAEDVDFHLKQILNGAFALDNMADTAFFEQKLDNDPGIEAFLPPGIHGVADVRIIFLEEKPIMAMLRVPTRESHGKANLHQGGIGIGVDSETGLTLDGCHRNKIIDKHPETGQPLRGRPIPHYARMREIGSRVGDIVELGYIGIDFVIDRTAGPLILEVNGHPGLNIQIANRAGLKSRLV